MWTVMGVFRTRKVQHCFAITCVTLWMLVNCPLTIGSPVRPSSSDTDCNRTAEPKPCGPYYCYNGVCYRNGTASNCKCFNERWTGLKCNICCPLHCSPHGSCDRKYSPSGVLLVTFFCNCDYGYEGDHCGIKQCLKQCKNGKCVLEDDKQKCKCDESFVGELCERLDPNYEPPWYKPTVGCMTTLALCLVLAGVIMPYIMWRQRAPIILRIHYFFKGYKDDSSLQFDAFISCTSDSGEDLDLVRETLCPLLETSMKYKVCYGERDFPYGESWIDSMCTAVKDSRRTILILSPAFMKDTWPIFQMQLAQHESLQSAHRIIPVIHRDLGIVTNPTLKHILSSLQCLRLPDMENKRQVKSFCKKLAVLMPKVSTLSDFKPIRHLMYRDHTVYDVAQTPNYPMIGT